MGRYLTEEEKRRIEALGGFDKLIETLRERLKEQRARHQSGSKWIGAAGTSAFGADGTNPEGVRIGHDEGRQASAAKVLYQPRCEVTRFGFRSGHGRDSRLIVVLQRHGDGGIGDPGGR